MTASKARPPGRPLPTPPRVALARWLSQINYNGVRNIETAFPHITQSDRARPLRGFKIAEDLVLTRKRTFYRIKGPDARPMSIEEVSANYSLELLQAEYRKATQMWKDARRKRTRTA